MPRAPKPTPNLVGSNKNPTGGAAQVIVQSVSRQDARLSLSDEEAARVAAADWEVFTTRYVTRRCRVDHTKHEQLDKCAMAEAILKRVKASPTARFRIPPKELLESLKAAGFRAPAPREADNVVRKALLDLSRMLGDYYEVAPTRFQVTLSPRGDIGLVENRDVARAPKAADPSAVLSVVAAALRRLMPDVRDGEDRTVIHAASAWVASLFDVARISHDEASVAAVGRTLLDVVVRHARGLIAGQKDAPVIIGDIAESTPESPDRNTVLDAFSRETSGASNVTRLLYVTDAVLGDEHAWEELVARVRAALADGEAVVLVPQRPPEASPSAAGFVLFGEDVMFQLVSDRHVSLLVRQSRRSSFYLYEKIRSIRARAVHLAPGSNLGTGPDTPDAREELRGGRAVVLGGRDDADRQVSARVLRPPVSK